MTTESSSSAADDYERNRLLTLRQLNLLDTPPNESFDRITRIAARLFDLPIAAVSLTDVDRQWFKSRVGVEHWEIPRFRACCGEVADTCGAVVVPDLLESEVYRDSVLAHSGIRFYAGAPLTTQDGYTLGAMCVLGEEPRSITDEEYALLHDLAAMVMSQVELRHAIGRIDPLSGLPNRSQFMDDLQDLARDNRGEQRFVLFIDLIDPGQMNALRRVMGPSWIDTLSRDSGRYLRQYLGDEAALYQVGPCQFVQLIQAADDAAARQYARGIRRELDGLQLGNVSPLVRGAAVGIAPLRLGETQPGDALRRAQGAGEDARQEETGVALHSTARDAENQRRFALLSDFRVALGAADQLHLAYHPRMRGDQCVAVEALLRWRHPELGDVSPAEFVPLVENTPLSRPLTDWVLLRALYQTAEWMRQGVDLRVSINIVASNLEEDDFSERLLTAMRALGVPAERIELELVESALISSTRTALQQLEELKDAGIRIAIDDFGTGYSSLAYLQRIPAEVIKIDRSLVSQVHEEEGSQTLLRAMISMAHDLGYQVVAEGVETEPMRRVLDRIGTDEQQGFLFTRPLAADALEHWLQAHSG